MTDVVETTGSDSAEKAYAAAAEGALAKAEAAPAETLEFPAKPKRAVASKPVAADPAPAALPAKAEADLVMPSRPAVTKAPAKTGKPSAKPASKPVAAKPVATAKKAVAAKPAKAAKPKINPVSKPTTPISKEPKMATKQTKDFTASVKAAAADVQAKAKLALAKGSALYGEASSFTKGNVEAITTSGKILSEGLQGLGKTYAAEGKSAYETVASDVKALAAVKSPVEFVRLQTAILRRNLDHAFDFGGKNSEAVIKLASDAIAPISARASLAVELVKKAA